MKKFVFVSLLLPFVNLPGGQSPSGSSWLPAIAGLGVAGGLCVANMLPRRLAEPKHPVYPAFELRKMQYRKYFLHQIKENPDFDFSQLRPRGCCEYVAQVERKRWVREFRNNYSALTLPVVEYREGGLARVLGIPDIGTRNAKINQELRKIEKSERDFLPISSTDERAFIDQHAGYTDSMHKIQKQNELKFVLYAGSVAVGLLGLSKLLLGDTK